MKRRDLLKAAPASVAALAAGGAAVALETKSGPLRAMYNEWQAAKVAYNTSSFDEEDPREVAMFEHLISFEQRAADFVPETLEDMIFKIIFADDNGDMRTNTHQKSLVLEAYRLAGLTPTDGYGDPFA